MINQTYISCGCNRTPHSACWGNNKSFIYGSCRAVVVCESGNAAQARQVCVGHVGRVNAVAWVRRDACAEEREFVSVSTDHTARVWRLNSCSQKYETCAILKGHTNTVTVVDSLEITSNPTSQSTSQSTTQENTEQGSTHAQRQSGKTLVVTGSVDSTVRIWQRKEGQDEFTCTQSVSFGSGFSLDVALGLIPGSNVPILACGGDDCKIHVFVQQDDQFIRVQSIPGHEDWVRALAFTTDDNGDLLLASGSQDTYIRVHRFSSRDVTAMRDLLTQANDLDLEEDIKMKETAFFFQNNGKEYCFAVTLDSVLQGHENWIYSVQWHPKQKQGETFHQPLCLLSASMDKTMILWRHDPDTGLWSDEVRVGEVGGNSLGFYGGLFSPDAQSIMAHGYQGAFQLWTKTQDNTWEAKVTCGGHFDSVEDVAWQRDSANYLLSLSADQTTRCHGYWAAADEKQRGWYEIARPQIHGYDMQCIAPIDRYSFAAGADEKVLRVFSAPRNFVQNFASISQLDLSHDLNNMSLPEGASVPALGLSNKAIYETELTQETKPDQDEHRSSQYPEVYFTPQTLTRPPDENSLLQNTLWPEEHKLYGHGYELYSVAAHPDGNLIASACKASKPEHACIMLWQRAPWRQVAELTAHALTVTHLRFSHSGHLLLSVSRDRTWSLFKARSDDQSASEPLYSRIAYTEKKTSLHSRIIWACAWSHDDAIFVTVSRDKKAILWSKSESGESPATQSGYSCCCAPLDLGDSVTAVDFAPCLTINDRYLLAFGLESGRILLYTWDKSQEKSPSAWNKVTELCQSDAHHLTVKRLQFRPRVGKVGSNKTSQEADNASFIQLASCGADHIVRVYTIDLRLIKAEDSFV